MSSLWMEDVHISVFAKACDKIVSPSLIFWVNKLNFLESKN